MGIKILEDKCIGCKLCLKACNFNSLEMCDKKAKVIDGCTACMACVSVCPVNAIEPLQGAQSSINIADYKGVWVYGEQRDGKLEPVTIELIGEGRKIANIKKVPLSVLVIGSEITGIADELAQYEVDSVLALDNEDLKDYSTQAYTTAISNLANERKPEIILIGATTLGRDLAPRISARLKTGLTADCTTLEVDPEDGKLKQTRPAFGGNIMATIVCPNHRPQMSTVRPGVMEKGVKTSKKANIENIAVKATPQDLLVKIIDKVIHESSEMPITEAPVLVAAGRGAGSKEGLEILQQLAHKMGGVIVGSRATVDEGLLPHSKQVGQTGTTVRPKLYIACGISGAIQHVAGMQDSEFIVAINKDPDAPIFKIADVGIVGDINDVIPNLLNQL